jgi:Uma2 family endonuclease
LGKIFNMAEHALLVQQEPLVVHTRPVIDLDEEQFFQFCQLNRDLQIERTAEGDIIIMAPEGGSSGVGSSELTMTFGAWAKRDGTGQVFGSSTGFTLPNGAMRSPDVGWVRNERLDALTEEEWQRFLPLCPDFVLELRSPSDRMRGLQKKMEEYRDNGAQLGWLLDPMSKAVHVYRPRAEVEVLENPASVSGEPVLRGFILDVQQIWAVMERNKKA